MKNSFRVFVFVFFVPIVVILLAILFNVILEAIALLISVTFAFLTGIGIAFLGEKISKRHTFKIVKAPDNELQREDDVLLQTVTFSAAIVFFYINFLIKDDDFHKLTLSAIILILAISFYTLRAWGKIKKSPKHRWWSMILLAALIAAYASSFFQTILQVYLNVDRSSPLFTIFIGITAALFGALLRVFDNVFSKRYGFFH